MVITAYRLNVVPLVPCMIEKLGQARDGPLRVIIRVGIVDDRGAIRRAVCLCLLEITDRVA